MSSTSGSWSSGEGLDRERDAEGTEETDGQLWATMGH